MQSAYQQYDMPYTPMLPQHMIMGSPQINSYQQRSNDFNPNMNGGSNGQFGYGFDSQPVGPDGEEYDDSFQQQQSENYIGGDYQDLDPRNGGLNFAKFEPQPFLYDHQGGINGDMLVGDDYYGGMPTNGQFDYGSGQDRILSHRPSMMNTGGMGGLDFNTAPSRTVYLGNIPADITPREILDHVRSGVIESFRILSEKNCAFISFLDESSALLFHSDAILKRLSIKDKDIKIGWGRPMQISPVVKENVGKDNATRNVYLGNLSKNITEAELINDLSNYGLIDTIKILPAKGVAFVHFCSIASAINVVSNLAQENSKYLDKKIYYGKDRCAFITKTQQHNAAQYLGLAPGMEHLVTNADREFISSTLLQQSAAAAAIATTAGGANNLGNRTVYLGNLPMELKIEEICNVVRGGLLETVKYLSDRNICFITFIDPIAAAQFFAMSQLHGLTIHNKRIKIGWGKHSGPLSNGLTLAVSSGASRNIYIGNIDLDDPSFSQDALRAKFEEFGEIEQINYLREKNCVFVNFTNISNAILAIDKFKNGAGSGFEGVKVNFGKDRCGNTPRQFNNSNNHGSNNHHNKFNHHNNSVPETEDTATAASTTTATTNGESNNSNDNNGTESIQ
ncbi:hypothetical protein WICPIJ_004859 [Wickerhamomyces pijperi]|uniref:RRM domain-containing protein n=1 Tax=Wickerhamomyces pijperi TaxID=599730 RepID=A0A9P8Q6T1_WICPI|nr:hypothetical protein WICPIJ_004859 [Wickerhamomyces pijperi]